MSKIFKQTPEDEKIWPPMPFHHPNGDVLPTSKSFSTAAISRLGGFPAALVCLFISLLIKIFLFPDLWRSDSHYSHIHYWLSIILIFPMAMLAMCWSVLDIFRTWRTLKHNGKLLDSLIFLLGFAGLLASCLSFLTAFLVPEVYPFRVH